MPLLYEIPPLLQMAINSNAAELVGAIIKDKATGHILGHVQQTGVMSQVLNQVGGFAGQAVNAFSPLQAVSILQNEHLRRKVAELKEGMILMQGLQYGTLALSGLGIGVSVAGFAMMAARLRGIETRLKDIASAISEISATQRADDVRGILADVSADIRNVDGLTSRANPQSVAERMQENLARSAARLDQHLRREADVTGLSSLPLEQLDRLWSLAAAIRLCQEAGIQALFAADELRAAEDYATLCLQEQMELLEMLSPDALARLVARGDGALRPKAVEQAQLLSDGIRGGVMALAGQISIAGTLRAEGTRGIDYMRQVRAEETRPLLFLPA
ncbi:MAG: hypothetical protein H5U17_00550 [Defluviimonas sp.]|nr:hypothetical protein [Defluviimonas sp.]